MKFIKEHKTISIVTLICLVLLILLFIAVYSIFNPTSRRNVYGSRLDGEVTVLESSVDTIKNEINESSIVDSVTYNKSVRTLKFTITVKDDAKEPAVEKLGDIVLNNFSKEVLEYYDVQIAVAGDGVNFPMIGYKSKSASTFTWTIHRGDVSE